MDHTKECSPIFVEQDMQYASFSITVCVICMGKARLNPRLKPLMYQAPNALSYWGFLTSTKTVFTDHHYVDAASVQVQERWLVCKPRLCRLAV